MKEKTIMEFQTIEETERWVKQWAAFLKAGDLIQLQGDLGAGKTQLVQWIGEIFQVKEAITSPSFNLVHRYQSPLFPIFHLDCYRMEEAEEILDLNYEEMFFNDESLTFIEWGERIEDFLPLDRIILSIEKIGEDARSFQILSHNERSRDLEEKMKEAL